MSLFNDTFYDEFWNFNNKKFLDLLEKSRKQKFKANKKLVNGGTEIVLFSSVSKKELWKFINKFSIFINSWIDVKWALGILVKQTKNPKLKKIIKQMYINLDHWVSISETMQQYPKVFDGLTISLINVWEKTGLLGKILSELDVNMLDSIELKARIKSALTYPLIMIILTISMLVFMMVFIVPRITAAFGNAGVSIPPLTQFVIDTSNFIQNDWLTIIGVMFTIFVIYKLLKKTYKGRLFFANLARTAPVFGYIIRMSNIVYFIRSFTILLDAWVLLLESLRTAGNVVPNLAYKQEVIRLKNEVEFGITISRALGLNLEYEETVYLNPYFPEDFAYVVNTGEETGSISKSLQQLGKNYNSELKRYIGNLSTAMEPMIIVFVGAMVGTIVIAIMLPFFQLGKVVQNM